MSDSNKIVRSLYKVNEEIDNIIANNTDLETGEISAKAWEEIEALEISKTEIQNSLVGKYKETNGLIDMIEAEEKRLAEMKKVVKNGKEYIKRKLEDIFPEKTKTVDFSISYRNTESVIVDDDVNLEFIKENYPHLIKEKLELNKIETKKFLEETGVIIPSVRIDKKKSLVIK